MNRKPVGLAVAAAVAVYVASTVVFGYEQRTALVVHFMRLSILTAAFVLYLPSFVNLFRQKPSPPRDYLTAGILLIILSNDSFSIWNEMSRVYGVDASVFTSPISGFFSLMALGAGIFFFMAPHVGEKVTKPAALFIGLLFGVVLVWFIPKFR